MNKASEDAWNIAEGQHDGYPAQIRYRPEINIEFLQSRFNNLLTITWEYELKEEDNYLPGPGDFDSMHNFETQLTDSLEENEAGVITFIFTSNGKRIFNYYVNDIDAVSDILNTRIEPGLPIQLSVEEDEEWLEFKNILELVGE